MSPFGRRHRGTPDAVIVLRQSPDWGSLGHANLARTETLDRALRRPSGFTRGFIELWDATFRTSFFEVRRALKQITLRSFAAVEGARVVSVQQVTRWPPADLVLFSDDDDWYAPHVVTRIAPVARSRDGVRWTSVYYDGTFVPRDPGFCYTNNYAVTGGARFPGLWTERVLPHGKAHVTFLRAGLRVAELDAPLSVSNKHPASSQVITEALARTPGRDGLVAEVEAFNERAARTPPPTGELSWAAEPVSETVRLFADLGTR